MYKIKCSAKRYSAKYWACTSDKETVNNTFEEVLFGKVAGLQPATLLKMTPPQVSFKIFDYKCGTNIL